MALTKVSRGLLTTSIVDNGNATAITIDSSENVGIGTSSPQLPLHVTGGFPTAVIERDTGASGAAGLVFTNSTTNGVYVSGSDENYTVGHVTDYEGSPSYSERLRIDSAGNVGIGTSSPATNLDGIFGLSIQGSTSGGVAVGTSTKAYLMYTSASTSGDLVFWDSSNNVERLRIASNGSISIPNQNAINELSFTGTEFTNVVSATTSGFQFGTTGAGYLAFLTNNSEQARITSAGKLVVNGTSAGYSGTDITVGSPSASSSGLSILSTTSGNGYLLFGDVTGDGTGGYSGQINYVHSTNKMGFYTNNSERITIDSLGRVMVGKTVGGAPGTVGFEVRPDGEVFSTINSGFNTYHVYANSGYRFYVNPNGGLYNYSANNVNLSDEREKKNIEPLESQWDSLQQWSLKKFHYNADADSDTKKLGVIAQEVEVHNPEIISEFSVDEDTTRMAVKEQQMMWMAIKALQEAMERIETLEAKVQTLENK